MTDDQAIILAWLCMLAGAYLAIAGIVTTVGWFL